VLVTRGALAEERRRIVVADLEGPSAAAIRGTLLRALAEHSEVYLVRLAHARELAGGDLKENTKTLARRARISAVLEGSVEGSDTEWVAKLRVRSTGDAEIAESHVFRGATRAELQSRLRAELWRALGPALAEAEVPKTGPKRVLVLPLTGKSAERARARILAALAKDKSIELVPEDEVPNGVSSDASAKELARAARKVGATVVLSGGVTTKAGKLTVSLSASGADGKAIGEASAGGFGVAGMERAIDQNIPKQLQPWLAGAEEPAPPEEDLEELPEDEEPVTPPKKIARPSPLELWGTLHAFTRRMRYTDDVFKELHGYDSSLVPAARLDLRWYPSAHLAAGVPAHVGLAASYERGFLLKSKAPNGDQLDTSTQEWMVGLRGRIPLAPHELGVEALYGAHSFSVDDDPAVPLLPDVRYRFLRFGLDGRARIGALSAGGRLGYRSVQSSGDIGTGRWFPNLDVGGVDAAAFAGYALSADLDIVAGVTYRRYFYTLNPEPGDLHVAGGALDQYMSGFAGVVYRMPGAP
jgi:hypothetical protein